MIQASTILYNGNLLTMAEDERAQAVAIGQDGRILAVGSDTEVLNLAVSITKKIDLRGKTLIPGFFDCHLHAIWLGQNLGHVDLSSPSVKVKEDILRLLTERLEASPEAAYLEGNRYDQNKLPDGKHLDRRDLDRVSTDIPVRIVHTSGHAAVVNSLGLQLLGIDSKTENPVGGEIERDEKGEATGVLLETASWNNLERIQPETTQSDAVAALGRANDYLLKLGITSASDANTPPGMVAAYSEAVFQDVLNVRFNSMIGWQEVIDHSETGVVPRPDDLQPAGVPFHRYHVGQAKLFSDGAITTRTCWLTQPFEGMPGNTGIAMHSEEQLRDYILKAHNAGWQIATHAIGDRAVDVVLSAYAEAQRQRTRTYPGHRIEHCMLLNPDLISRLRRQKVWSIGQPEFISGLGDAYLTALGEERARRLSPYATLEAQNVAQAFSSDCPVVPGSPLAGMKAAISRATPKGYILNDRERVSAEYALSAYTYSPAYATRTERHRGSIEAGKLADFTLLSADPLATHLDDWERIEVAATIVNGQCLYGELG